MLKFLFSPNGRISRADIWLKFLLPYIALSILAGIIDDALGLNWSMMKWEGSALRMHDHDGPVSALLGLFYLWPSFAVPIKRFHDRGMTGWWVLIFILLVVAGVVVAAMGVPFEQLFAAETHEEMHEIFRSLPPQKLMIMAAGGLWVALVSITSFVILYLLPGQRGDNKYGSDPRDKG